MSRKILLLLIILLVVPLVSSATKFVFQETDAVRIDTSAEDPDNDNLIWVYSNPLNASGEWQTTYGDEGEYKSIIEVSDGQSKDSKEILIVVKRKEERPVIESYIPKESSLETDELSSIDFRVLASDLNGDDLQYLWQINGKKVSEGQEFKYSPSFNDDGAHKITIEISDGTYKIYKDWDVYVKNVDVENMLNSIPDMEATETDAVSLQLPDFANYGLTYSISLPVGNENKWQTNYDDAGKYKITIHAEGNGFKADKQIELTIKNLDRPIDFQKIKEMVISETENARIELKGIDPDNDTIIFIANKIPNGSNFDGSVFTWTPSQNYVMKSGLFDRLMDKIGLMSRTSYIQFSAVSNNREVIQNGIITVRDLNRAPVIEDMPPLVIREGETAVLNPIAYDQDYEKFSLKYSGVSSANSFKAGYDAAGNYTWTVTASDGKSKSSKDFVLIVESTNRAPVWKSTDFKKAREGEETVLLLNAIDLDNDLVNFTLENEPDYSSIKGNIFYYTPSYETVSDKDRIIELVFVAHDNKGMESKKIIPLIVQNTNRAPIIAAATSAATTKVNKPVAMFVNATDQDADMLKYTWHFGFFDSFEGANIHQRTFTSAGVKQVRVAVSDGKEVVNHLIAINVLDEESQFQSGFSLSIYENFFAANKKTSQTAKNNPPRIIEVTDNVVVKQNEPAIISIRAVDDDNDPIKYSWDLKGLEYSKSGTSKLIFPKKGEHIITVLVSDGKDVVKKQIKIYVI